MSVSFEMFCDNIWVPWARMPCCKELLLCAQQFDSSPLSISNFNQVWRDQNTLLFLCIGVRLHTGDLQPHQGGNEGAWRTSAQLRGDQLVLLSLVRGTHRAYPSSQWEYYAGVLGRHAPAHAVLLLRVREPHQAAPSWARRPAARARHTAQGNDIWIDHQ